MKTERTLRFNFPRFALAISFALLFGPVERGVRADSPSVAFVPEQERILLVELFDGTPVSDGIVAYETKDGWFLPVYALGSALGFALQYSENLREVDGHVLSEDRRFHLALDSCTVEFEKKTEKLDGQATGCRGIVAQEGDLYGTIELIQKWFPIRLEVERFRSRLLITPTEKLPLQAKMERDATSRLLRMGMAAGESDYPEAPIGRRWIDGLMWDQRLREEIRKDSGSRASTLGYETGLGGEILGMEASLQASGTTREFGYWKGRLRARDRAGKVLCPACFTEVDLIHLDLPSLPLALDGGQVLGMLVSNYPLTAPRTFATQEIQGDGTPGWDVELYQNGILVDRQVVDAKGRYLFTQLPLYFGSNYFQIVLYGPQGQQIERYRTYQVGQNRVQPGKTFYRASLFEQSGGGFGSVLMAERSLTPSLGFAAGLARTRLRSEAADPVLAYGAVNGFTSWFLAGLHAAASSRGGLGLRLETQVPVGKGSLSVKHTRGLGGFKSLAWNDSGRSPLSDESRVDATTPLPFFRSVGTTTELKRENRLDLTHATSFTERIYFPTGPVNWQNDLTYKFEEAGWSGRLGPSVFLGGHRIRTLTNYKILSVDSQEVSWQSTFFQVWTATFGVKHDFAAKGTTVTAGSELRFKPLSVGANSSIGPGDSFSVVLNVGTSLLFDPYLGVADLSNSAQSETGAAVVDVYVDRNRNDEKDPEEPSLPGVAINTSQTSKGFAGGADGRVLLGRLPPHVPLDISVSAKTMKDPMLKVPKKGVKITPRAGKIGYVKIPIHPIGEVDGRVTSRRKSSGEMVGVARLEVQAVPDSGPVAASKGGDAPRMSAKTDVDGYFLIEDLAPGRYRLVVKEEELKRLGLSQVSGDSGFEIQKEGGIVTEKDLIAQ